VLFCATVALFGSIGFAQEDDLCLACHDDTVTADPQLESVHGEMGLTCVDCHVDLAGLEDFPHAEELQPADCGGCHFDVQEEYVESLHGYALLRGNERAPTCASCHGDHDIASVSDPSSPIHESRQHEICAACHGVAGVLTDQLVKFPQTLSGYAKSVHGPNGDPTVGGAAKCTDCHGVHGLRGPADPDSKINRANLAETCGTCHGEAQDDYEQSIHGRALKAGVLDSPTCTDCHGEHMILSPDDPDSMTSAGHLATESCGNCHDDPVLTAKYGLSDDTVGSYVDSYHGWAVRRNYKSAATCVSCHTAHLVLPETHEDSTIHHDNLVETCQQCHPGANEKFAHSYTHATVSITENPINRWIRSIYLTMIVVVIGGMAIHNGVIVAFYANIRRRRQKTLRTVKRLDRLQLAQHSLMGLSFIVLGITGFALRFPEAWWVRWLSGLGMGEGLRAYTHRIAGVVMLAVAIAHVLYIMFVRRGRYEFKAMLPGTRDFREALDNMLYHLGRRDEHAQFGRYDYTQKAEYWALAWGTFLMVVTGAVLWFPQLAVKFLPAWVVTASQTVHYYEAWLAVLAIIVWHLFFVLFHPDEYPMNWTWLTGKMTERALKRHHPRWYQEVFGKDDEDKPGSG
jgi:formate dehydrogenase gamma subunit